MKNFFKTAHCTSRVHCGTCRNKEGGRSWRKQILSVFKDTDAPEDFECPHGLSWGYTPVRKQVEMDQSVLMKQPPISFKKVKSFVQAVFTGKYVSAEIVAERSVICSACEYLRTDPNGLQWCGVCGCKTSAENRKINNLASYEENLPEWGCKHKDRALGKGWKR